MGWEIEIPDVVAGQPIESAWGNAIRNRVVHRVATAAVLPTDVSDGSIAYVEDVDRLYLRKAGAWVFMDNATAGMWDGTDRNGFTNTSMLDLNNLTGGTGVFPNVAVSLLTGASALVSVYAAAMSATSGAVIMGYRISGASTVASAAAVAARNAQAALVSGAFSHIRTGLTPGVNVFTLQAQMAGGTTPAGRIITPSLVVTAL
jgi:hypothetical protein